LLFLFHLRSPLSALRSTLTYKCRPMVASAEAMHATVLKLTM
jgi:hypothetical protein